MKIVHAHAQSEVNASNFSSGHVLCNKLSLRENSMMRRKLIGCVWSFVGIDPRADRRDCCEVFGAHHANSIFGWQHLTDYREPQESQTFFETRTLQTQCPWQVIAYGAKANGFSTFPGMRYVFGFVDRPVVTGRTECCNLTICP